MSEASNHHEEILHDQEVFFDPDEGHSGFIKTPKQLLLAVIYAFVVPVFLIIALIYYVGAGDKAGAGSTNPEKAISERIAKVGTVEVKDENAPLQTGEFVYKNQCIACHGTGAAGAPKFEDKGAWSARIATGYDKLLGSALKGKGAMPAQGGGNFNDIEIGRAVVFMANAAGAKFAVPDRPAAAPAAAK